jgi:cytochrome c2
MRRISAAVAAGVAFAGAAFALIAAAQPSGGPAGDPAKGQAVFADRCADCHTLGVTGQGPNLVGVVGRKAASLPDYPYSDALRASGLTWTVATLDRFLQGSRTLVPGTAMDVSVPDATDRRDVIAYLATAHG